MRSVDSEPDIVQIVSVYLTDMRHGRSIGKTMLKLAKQCEGIYFGALSQSITGAETMEYMDFLNSELRATSENSIGRVIGFMGCTSESRDNFVSAFFDDRSDVYIHDGLRNQGRVRKIPRERIFQSHSGFLIPGSLYIVFIVRRVSEQ